MKRLSTLFLLILTMGLLGCSSLPDAFVYFHNHSSITVYVSRNCAYPLDSISIFNQDIGRWNEIHSGKSNRYPAEPGLYLDGYGGSWNLLLSDTYGYVSFYVIDQSIKESLNTLSIDESYPVIVRYDLTASDLEKLDYKVDYPPTEQMMFVHMYPPYETFASND